MKKQLRIVDGNREVTVPNLTGMPYTYYINTFSKNTYDEIGWHWHDEMQLCVVLDGTIRFQAGQHLYNVSEGNGFWVCSRQIHRAVPEQENKGSYLCLDIDTAVLTTDTGIPALSQNYWTIEAADRMIPAMTLDYREFGDVLTLARNIQRLSEAGESVDGLQIYADLYLLLAKLGMRLEQMLENGSRDGEKNNERMISILSYIHEHYKENVKLEEIAASVLLSEGECCRMFRQTFGQTIIEYLRDYRVRKAGELLRTTTLSVAEIAYAVGFGGQSYFASVFRKETGCTPTAYRKSF